MEKEMKEKGILYLVATPIGNLEDMTFRAIRILKEADLIAAEDTRNSIKLLNYFEIDTPMTSYHEYNKIEKGHELVNKLLEGTNIALITDAGTPGISDPGEELVKMSIEAGITVTSVPGACAAITALTMSGQKTRRFVFEAFLPTDKKECKEVLDSLRDETRTIIIYEAPHRLKKTLALLKEILGDRMLTLCKELTKKHECIKQGTLSELISFFETEEPKGEYVLVISGKDRDEIKKREIDKWNDISIEEHFNIYIEKGFEKKDAMKAVALDRGIPKRDVYNALNKD